MRLTLLIAARYLVSRKKRNFINIISWLSVTGVAVITAALIIVLSVFNGLEELLRSLHNSFDPAIKIIAAKGKSFEFDKATTAQLQSVSGVLAVTQVIEDYAYVRYRGATKIVTIKGVDESFIKTQRIPKENIVEGDYVLMRDSVPYALVGNGVRYTLSLAPGNDLYPLQVFYINTLAGNAVMDPSRLYSRKIILPSAAFSIVQNIDDNYIVVPIEFARDLMNYGSRLTALEITVQEGQSRKVEAELAKILGEGFLVLNHEEQHADIYRLLNVEKLVAFLALSLLLLVGSINIFFSLSMLAIDKKKDLSVLASLGATPVLIRNVFLAEGAMIAIIGAFIGITFGSGICLLQQEYGFVSMGLESAVMSGYPVKLRLIDLFLTLLVVIVITFLLSFRPAVMASRMISIRHL